MYKNLFKKYQHSNIGKRHWNVELEFIKDKDVKKIIKEYIEKIEEKILDGKGLFFLGTYGCGKTSTAISIVKEFYKIHKTVYFLPISDLNNILFNQDKEKDELYKRILNVDLLILDDLDSQYESQYYSTRLESLIRHRYNNLKINFYTINNIKLLKNIMNGGVQDIIMQTSIAIKMQDINYRQELIDG